MKVLVLGANGMLGSSLIRVLSESDDMDVFGTVRSEESRKFFPLKIANNLLVGCNVENKVALFNIFEKTRPDVVINCISLSKELLKSGDPLRLIPIYSLLPHRLANLCNSFSARLVQISTDAVFSGTKGGYTENDLADAKDLYGISKFLGEVYHSNTITLRTSIIGHELQSSQALIDWFLSQQVECKCFSNVVFSGFPTVVLAKIIRDEVISRPDLFGLFHLATRPISKCELLRLVAEVYGKKIKILADDQKVSDRSLNADRFQAATGYIPPDWPELIKLMYSSR